MKTIEELLTENLALAAEIERLNTYIQDSGILERENRSKRVLELEAKLEDLTREVSAVACDLAIEYAHGITSSVTNSTDERPSYEF